MLHFLCNVNLVSIMNASFQTPHGAKVKKGKLSEGLKYCNGILKELFAKKHAVSYNNSECVLL